MSFYNKSATVVKMAVIGDVVFGDELDLVVPSDQIANFKYSLIGKDSYKFEIELVNYSEVFLTSITKAVNKAVRSEHAKDYTTLRLEPSNLQSLPKLVIQWGYEDINDSPALSPVHVAAITNVHYKFSQGKEKMLTIEAVFLGEGFDTGELGATYNSTVLVDVDMPLKTSPFSAPDFYINAKDTKEHLSILQIVKAVIAKFILNIDGYSIEIIEDPNPANNLWDIYRLQIALQHKTQLEDQEWMRDHDVYSNERIDEGAWDAIGDWFVGAGKGIAALFNDESQERAFGNNGVAYHTHHNSVRMGGLLPSIDHWIGLESRGEGESLENWVETSTRDNEAEELYWEKLESIFTYIGLTMTRPEFGDIKDELIMRSMSELTGKNDQSLAGRLPPTTKEDRSPKLTSDVPMAATLAEGKKTATTYLSLIINQDCGGTPIAPNTLTTAGEIRAAFSLNENDDFTANAVHINNENLSRPQWQQAVQRYGITKMVTFYKDTKTEMFVRNSFPIETELVEIGSLGQTVEAKMTQVAQEETKLQQIEKAEAENARKAKEDTAAAKKVFTNMSVKGRRDFALSNIKISAESPEGESVFKTINKIIVGYNNYADGKWQLTEGYAGNPKSGRLKMNVEQVTHTEESFDNVLWRLSNDPKEARTMKVTLGHGGSIDAALKDSLRQVPIISSDIRYPIEKVAEEAREKLVISEDETYAHGILDLSYGHPDSIVKFFDFKGDIRWLRNATIASVATMRLTGVYTHLQSKQVRKAVVPFAAMLLDNIDFLVAMKKIDEDKEEGEPTIVETLEILAAMVRGATISGVMGQIAPPPNMRLEDLKHVNDFLHSNASNADLEKAFAGDFKESLTTFHLFLAATADEQSLSLLMDKTIGGRYFLREHNVFDDRAGTDVSEEVNSSLQNYAENLNEFAEVRVKTLGIPEVSRLVDIKHRSIYLTVADPSENNQRRQHWLTGLYQIISLNHHISPSEGYSSEFKLIKQRS